MITLATRTGRLVLGLALLLVELARVVRRAPREGYTAILADFLAEAAPVLVPSGR